MLVISGLREEYNGLKSSLLARQSHTSFQDLHSLLVDHDFMIKKNLPMVAPVQAFTATSSNQSTPIITTPSPDHLQITYRPFNNLFPNSDFNSTRRPFLKFSMSAGRNPLEVATPTFVVVEATTTPHQVVPGANSHGLLLKTPCMKHVTDAVLATFHPSVIIMILSPSAPAYNPLLILQKTALKLPLGFPTLAPIIMFLMISPPLTIPHSILRNVVALHGKETNSGDFLVEDILEAGLPPQLDLPNKSGEDKYVVLVSGLNVGSSSSNPLQLQLLVDHITGHLGDKKEQQSAAEIVQVVVAGNSVKIDHCLLNGQIAAGIPIDIIPGYNDPTNFALPQQVMFLGTFGQNIDDLEKYSEAKDKLEFMERTLRWRHLAPTAPNTLGCYPFTDRDPFFIESCPHVYFVGNQEKYATRIVKGSQVVRVICVPMFSETGIAVMVNLKNLECHTSSFGTDI
ncbi:hypothetical protein Lser_V15G26377 [Lactuca serriola]